MAAIRAEPIPLRAQMRPGVAEDMQAILGGLAGPDDAESRSGRLTQVRSLMEPRVHGSRKGVRSLTIALLIGMAGVGLGVVLARGSADAPPAPARQTYVAATSPAPSPIAPIAPAPVAATLAADDTSAPSTPPPTPEPAVAQARIQPARPATPRPAPPPASPEPVASTATPSHDLGAGCDALGGAEQAACLAPAVLAADRELRRAYATAIDAGVERSIISSYRKRWSRLRDRSSDEPAYLIGSYAALAEDLYRLAEETRASGRTGW